MGGRNIEAIPCPQGQNPKIRRSKLRRLDFEELPFIGKKLTGAFP
jgi:hypothetical protein